MKAATNSIQDRWQALGMVWRFTYDPSRGFIGEHVFKGITKAWRCATTWRPTLKQAIEAAEQVEVSDE